MHVSLYSGRDAEQWDQFIARAPMATFLHTRRFLSYHGTRFRDVSLLIKDDEDRLIGLFPAALDPTNDLLVSSHPGITYGGVLHQGKLRGDKMLIALNVLSAYYLEQGFQTLRYKAVPYIYHRVPAADDSYALFRFGAMRYRCDLSCAVDLENRHEPSQRRKRGLKKALKHNVQVVEGAHLVEQLWKVIDDNLGRKYGLRPVHSAEEISKLHSLFPENIEFVVALLETQVVAGVVLFSSSQVTHAQYTASTVVGYEVCALDAVFNYCLSKAASRGMRYFDFGNSNENEGQYLNTDLYQFKSEFGGGGVVHEFYQSDLRARGINER